MPYCPRCDMEFVEGITVCSDCGGPLVESKDAVLSAPAQEDIPLPEDFPDSEPDIPECGIQKPSPIRSPSAAPYVSSRQKSEDLRSSSSAFLLVGAIAAAAAVLCWLGIIKITMAGASRILFQCVLTAMGVGFLFVSFSTRRSASQAAAQMQAEEQRTGAIIEWFLSRWNGSGLDEELFASDPELAGEELALKRYELIQDHLITGQDLPDPSYVDYLTDELYEKLYENQP